MRILTVMGLKRGGGRVRQLKAGLWPCGNVVAAEFGSANGARSVRWLRLPDGEEIHRRDLPGRGAPGPALSADGTRLAYVVRKGVRERFYLEKADEPERPAVELSKREDCDDLEDRDAPEYIDSSERLFLLWFAISPGNDVVQALDNGNGDLLGWKIEDAFTRPGPVFWSMYTSDVCHPPRVSAYGTNGHVAMGFEDGMWWVIDAEGNTPIWDTSHRDTGDGPIRALAFHPDCRTVAVGIADYVETAVLDKDSERGDAELHGHSGAVTALAFSPDGKTLATADESGVVRFWDGESEEAQQSWDWKVGRIGALAFSADGFTCIAGADRGRIVVWDVD